MSKSILESHEEKLNNFQNWMGVDLGVKSPWTAMLAPEGHHKNLLHTDYLIYDDLAISKPISER